MDQNYPSEEKYIDHCGVVALVSESDAATRLYYCLRAIQHRGQEAAGIAIFDGRISCRRGMGLVQDILNKENLGDLNGKSGIGHIRYSTTGTSSIQNAQPVVVSSAAGDVALAHNGDIVNSQSLRNALKEKGWAFITSSDSEVIVRLLANEIASIKDLRKSFKNVMMMLIGSYALTILVNDRVFAIRDPLGIKPLCIGKTEDGYVATSESVAIEAIGGELVRDVLPGEIVELTSSSINYARAPAPKHPAHCMFEWVYFARADSIIDEKLVHDVRWKIGQCLAEDYPVEADIVIPVPDSGRTHALGYSNISKIPYDEGLIKNRYVFRTFIMPEQKERERNIKLKMSPIKSLVDGKRAVLVDDSIVRGNTMKRIVRLLKGAGTKEIHVRIGCPPIIAPCYLGIDMKTRDQFIAVNRKIPEIAGIIGADTLGYLTIDRLVDCIGKNRDDLCLGCLTGEYPVEVPGEKLRFQKKIEGFE
jgi:amidophosphoribosyltransferase